MFLSPCNFWIKKNTKYDTQLENWMTPGSIIDHGLCLLKITLLIEMVRWTPSGYFYFLSYLWHFWTWLLLYWSKLLLSFVNVFRCILALVLMTICRLAFAALLLLLLGSLHTFLKFLSCICQMWKKTCSGTCDTVLLGSLHTQTICSPRSADCHQAANFCRCPFSLTFHHPSPTFVSFFQTCNYLFLFKTHQFNCFQYSISKLLWSC